jgi:hypothetical protein
MQIVIRGTHVVEMTKLWKRGELYQVSIIRPEMVEMLRPYDNREVTVIVAGVPFKARLKYETPKRGNPYIRIFLPKKLNVIWSRLHEMAGQVKVEIIIENEGTAGGEYDG